jgi:hypothetical protein
VLVGKPALPFHQQFMSGCGETLRATYAESVENVGLSVVPMDAETLDAPRRLSRLSSLVFVPWSNDERRQTRRELYAAFSSATAAADQAS